MEKVIPKPLLNLMHRRSQCCVTKYPHLRDHVNLCETAFISELDGDESFTLHNHSAQEIDYPSFADIRTTTLLNKKNLCIILPDRRVKCWKSDDFFQTPKEEFSF